ncbi:MAG TPA: nuclear transport factor 2 family protein [Trebonia sp.]
MSEYEEAIHEKATRVKALRPEDLTRLFVERANAKDADGIAELYEEHAVMAYPPGQQTVGREAIRAFWKQALPHLPRFEPEPPLPTLVSGDIALTSTPPRDGAGARAQVVRRQPDGCWLRLLDKPEFISVPADGSPSGERRPAAS